MTRIIAAAALALSLPFAVLAQDNAGMEQTRQEVMTAPEMQGIDVDVSTLTDEQVLEIHGILMGEGDSDDKEDRIEAIVEG